MKVFLLISITALIAANLFAGDNSRSGPISHPSILSFGPDVVISPRPEWQHDVKIATAFNGWNYAAFTMNKGVDSGGYSIMVSKDHGQNWETVETIFDAGLVYYAADLLVCGNDTSTMNIFFSSVLYTPADGNHIFFVNKYDSLGVVSNAVLIDTVGTDSIYDVALIDDFVHRSDSHDTTYFSVEAIYSKHSVTQDSIIAYQSVSNGTIFPDRKMVDTTSNSNLFGKISASYGYSSFGHPNGRYFVAYEEHSPGAHDGHIKVTGTDADITDIFTVSVYLDSLDSSWTNKGSNPTISVQNSHADNDSSGLSAVVLWQSNLNGSGNYDIDGGYTYDITSPTFNPWHPCWLDIATGTQTKEPDITFDEPHTQFIATYWDSTNNQLTCKVQSINFNSPTAWQTVSVQYNDQVGSLTAPHPQVVLDPFFVTPDFAWIETRGSYPQAIFDAENSFTGIQNTKKNSFNLNQNFPNPASDYTMIRFELGKSQQIKLDLYDLVGNKIGTLENKNLDAGMHQLNVDVRQLPAGYYMYTLNTGDEQLSKKLLIVH